METLMTVISVIWDIVWHVGVFMLIIWLVGLYLRSTSITNSGGGDGSGQGDGYPGWWKR